MFLLGWKGFSVGLTAFLSDFDSTRKMGSLSALHPSGFIVHFDSICQVRKSPPLLVQSRTTTPKADEALTLRA